MMTLRKLLFSIPLLQTDFADNDYTVPPDTAFTPIAPLFFGIVYAVATLLGLMSAYRIYINYNVGDESIIRPSVNLLLGMIGIVVITAFCQAIL